MTLMKFGDAARHETPNAVMRTFAAPSTGSAELSVWDVTMRAAQSGPAHTADREQVWLLLDGALRVRVDDTSHELAAGDALVIAAGAERQVRAPAAAHAIVSSPAAPTVTRAGAAAPEPLPWAA